MVNVVKFHTQDNMAYASSADPDQNAVFDQGLAEECAQILVNC